MKTSRASIQWVIESLLTTDAKRATYYLDPKQIVRATRRLYKHGSKNKTVEILLTISGKPNFLERKYVKNIKKSGGRFPVRKIQF